MPTNPTQPPPYDEEIRPLVIGPDGRISQGTPITVTWPAWPTFVTGSGDPNTPAGIISHTIARIINDMIVTSPFYTPEPVVTRNIGDIGETSVTNEMAATPAPSPTPSPTPTPDPIGDAYPDVDAMFHAAYEDFVRRAVESSEKRFKEAKDKAKRPDPKREHDDHIRSGARCWCGKEGIHAVGTDLGR